jgi:hypothetical protein
VISIFLFFPYGTIMGGNRESFYSLESNPESVTETEFRIGVHVKIDLPMCFALNFIN